MNTRRMYNHVEVSGNEGAIDAIEQCLERVTMTHYHPDCSGSFVTVTVINVERKSGTDFPSNSYHVEPAGLALTIVGPYAKRTT